MNITLRYLPCLAFACLALGGSTAAEEPSVSRARLKFLQARSLRIMEDIAPQPGPHAGLAKVTLDGDAALWGQLFNDEAIASLVAIQAPAKAVPPGGEQPPQVVDVCLVVRNKGWEFKQYIGTLAGRYPLEWQVKRHAATGIYYIVGPPGLYPVTKHPSWRFDSASNQLVPNHWPTDAVASLSQNSITFQRAEKPGYSPVIRTVHRFDGEPKEALVTIEEKKDKYYVPTTTLIFNNPKTGQPETWQVRPRSGSSIGATETYSLCHRAGEFEEQAVMELKWLSDTAVRRPAAYVFLRLTGLGLSAYEGVWDQDDQRKFTLPETVSVTGLPEAVERFSWPPADGKK